MAENFPETVGDAEAPESAPKPKKLNGRPFTKENAKEMALSAAKAKRMRKEARMQMLADMCTKLNLGEELVKAVRNNDDVKIGIVEKALKIVGLTHDQAPEALAQRFEIKADANMKHEGQVKLVIEDMTKPTDG